jgi:hypothetical protein
MAKRDNPYMVLMTNCNVKLECDGEKIELRYMQVEGKKYGVWFLNGENTGLQVTGLWKQLTEKYEHIKVLYKRQF